MAERVQELEESLNSVMDDNIQLTEAVVSAQRENILHECSHNLSQTQAAKLEVLAEAVDFVSAEDFAAKLETLRESYFGAQKVISEETVLSESETLTEGSSDRMTHYLAALRRTN